MRLTPPLPPCNWGQVQGAYVPAVTYCHLSVDASFNYDLGYYQNGFWVQSGIPSLPFLDQSWNGKYLSPPLNGAVRR